VETGAGRFLGGACACPAVPDPVQTGLRTDVVSGLGFVILSDRREVPASVAKRLGVMQPSDVEAAAAWREQLEVHQDASIRDLGPVLARIKSKTHRGDRRLSQRPRLIRRTWLCRVARRGWGTTEAISIRRTVPVTYDIRLVVWIGTFSAARAEKRDPIGLLSRVRTESPVAVEAQGVLVHADAPSRSALIVIVVCTPICGGQPMTSAVSISSAGTVSTSPSSKSRTVSP
jgi:hypothetical protein